MSTREDLFLRNCAGEVTDIKPVWIMRQAGRYLSEYREVRSRFPNFIDFYKNPEASKNIIFFENLINWNAPIILCEGVFDAMAIRTSGVAQAF